MQGDAAPRLRNVDWDFFSDEERKDIFLQVQEVWHCLTSTIINFRLFYECTKNVV